METNDLRKEAVSRVKAAMKMHEERYNIWMHRGKKIAKIFQDETLTALHRAKALKILGELMSRCIHAADKHRFCLGCLSPAGSFEPGGPINLISDPGPFNPGKEYVPNFKIEWKGTYFGPAGNNLFAGI